VEDSCSEINICERQAKRFADAEPGAVQQYEKQPECRRIYQATGIVNGYDRAKQAAQLFMRVDIGNEGLRGFRNGSRQR
jgi:hypothetical protein